LFIDTNTNQYYIHFKGLAKVRFEAHEEALLKIQLRLFFLNFDFFPFKNTTKRIKKHQIKKSNFKGRRKRISIKTMIRLLKTFKVKRFFLNIDTGDCIYNAKLYPIVAFLNYRLGHFNINFIGKNQLVLCLENRPVYILKSFINL
jgi:hypothetical protein